MPTNRNRAGLITESSSLFPNNTTQEISPADLRSWIADGTTSFVTQKDISTLENAIYENDSNPLAAGGTVDLSTANGNFVHITGASTITSFGVLPAGARFVLVFDGICLLTYNATSLIIPGSANKTTAAGDACLIISEGSGNWRIVGYFAISGSGGGGGTPGGLDTEIQYNNAGSFGGVPELTYSGGFVQIETPKIGVGGGNGHLHIHNATSTPSGIANYVTQFVKTSPKELGLIFGTDAYESYIKFDATADRTYTLPDATGNVLVDTVIPSLNNGTSAGEIRLKEATGSGSNYVAIKAPTTLAADYTLTLPADDGASAQVLQTDGAGLLSWVNQTPSAGISRINATTAGTTITGTTAKTKTLSVLVPANTFGAGTILQMSAFGIRTAGNSNGTMRIEVNTSDAIGGTLVASYVYVSTNSWFKLTREFIISNSTTDTSGFPSATGALNDNAAVVATIASSAIDWTIDQYLVVSMQNGAAVDATYCRAISILQK